MTETYQFTKEDGSTKTLTITSGVGGVQVTTTIVEPWVQVQGRTAQMHKDIAILAANRGWSHDQSRTAQTNKDIAIISVRRKGGLNANKG